MTSILQSAVIVTLPVAKVNWFTEGVISTLVLTLAAGRLVFNVTWLPVAVKLELAVIVNVPEPNVNLLGLGISVIESAVIEKLPIFMSSWLPLTTTCTSPAVCAVANGNAYIASNPKLINNP